jgi:hypothetical protein
MISRRLVVALIVFIVLAVGAFAALSLTPKSKPAGSTKSTSNTIKYPAPVSPTAILKNHLPENIGKNIAVKGYVVSPKGSHKYYVIDPEDKPSGALLLDFSTSDLNPDKYASVIEATSSPKNSVLAAKGKRTLQGVLQSETNSPALLVRSIY